jgi:LmbE family N-acetylglucosaminyl deacetylase
MPTLLAIHAHPDDLETFAGGLLTFLTAQRCRVVMATMTAGECGSSTGDPGETGSIRRAEAQIAADLIGAEHVCLGLPDLGVFNDDPSRRATTELIRRIRPDIVITAPSEDYHPDHEATSLLVRDACFAASAAAYRTGPAPALDTIPHLYFMDPAGPRSRDGSPAPAEFGLDISPFMATKRRLLEAHRSQVDWLKKQHGIDSFTASMEAQAGRRGRDFGVPFAEGYRQYRGTPYPRDEALQRLLGDALLVPPA